MTIQTSISTIINAPISLTFDNTVSADARVFAQKHGPIPGIAAIDGHTEPWSEPGQIREYTLTDQTKVTEEITAFTLDHTYSYAVRDFTGPLRHFVKNARSEWHFTVQSSETTRVDWTYFFNSKNPVAGIVLWLFIKLFWPGFMRQSLTVLKTNIQTNFENQHSVYTPDQS